MNDGRKEFETRKEQRQRKAVKALIDGKMDEYGVTKRTLYAVMGIFGCFVLTIVMSITGMGFDPSLFGTWNYWTGMVVQFGIAIFAMITGRQIGDDTQRNRPDGQFRSELRVYKSQYDRITGTNIFEFFDDWLLDYREGKLQRKIKETLRDFGIKQMEVLDLDFDDLEDLRHPFRKDWTGTPFYEKYLNPKTGKSETIFKSLSDDQIEVVRQVMNGKVRVSYVSASYFMNALKGTSVDEWERAAKADKKKGARLASGYTYRLFILLAFSLVVNGLIPVAYESAAAVWLNIATRVFVLISSAVWGIYLGYKIVDMDIVFLAFKSYILRLFADQSESGAYVHETISQQAEREYEEFEEEKRKKEEATITPEIVDPDTPILLPGK